VLVRHSNLSSRRRRWINKHVIVKLECDVVPILRFHVKVNVVAPLSPPVCADEILFISHSSLISSVEETAVFFRHLGLNDISLLLRFKVLAEISTNLCILLLIPVTYFLGACSLRYWSWLGWWKLAGAFGTPLLKDLFEVKYLLLLWVIPSHSALIH